MRFLAGLAIYAVALISLLLLARHMPVDQGWNPFPLLVTVLVGAQIALWLRDRWLPSKDSRANSGRPTRWLESLCEPPTIVIAAFAIGCFLPTLLLTHSDEIRQPQGIGLTARLVSYWAVSVFALAIFIMKAPPRALNQIARWWLPNFALLFLSWAAIRLMPGLIHEVAHAAGQNEIPFEPAWLLLPLAALATRLYLLTRAPNP
jgi:hypothetical protein